MRTSRKREVAVARPSVVRCAIYTRKSTEEGLQQEFNSLDAQREAAEAFIKSQSAEGWIALPDRYDDGGFSGGNMDRPALKRLMSDVNAGKVDCIVVYKVDRLSRSLLDFSRIMESLDGAGASFVSVTQHFNTTHSMGRLTLNILLSFAQFEREIIAERTRDKMSAARRKGKWVGGHPFLGYDIDFKGGKLLVNHVEAEVVRGIFGLYLEKRSLLETLREVNARGWERKRWLTRENQMRGGGPWDKNNLHYLLTNIAYIGKVSYKGEIFPGEHEAILEESVWAETQAMLRQNGRSGQSRKPTDALLRGVLCCAHCQAAMLHTYTVKKKVRRYRYYVCMRAQKQGFDVCPNRSLPAAEIERFVVDRIREIGRDPELLRETIAQVRAIHTERLADAERRARSTVAEARALQAEIRKAVDDPRGLADLADQLRAAEGRVGEASATVASIREDEINVADVTAALGMFDPLWETMRSAERERVIQLLLERVAYNGKEGTVAITFRASGIKTLANQQQDTATP
jgi:site-specific DNA recombinase